LSPTPADQTIARYLVPRLVAFVTDTEPEDPERARSLIAHTLVQYVGTVAGDKNSSSSSTNKDRTGAAMALVLPALLTRASSEGEDSYRETSARLLELAAVDQAVFRAVVAGMNDGQRAFLEEVIRWGRQGGGGAGAGAEKTDGAAAGRPTIALKMNFGG
jgi:hypothetical protein